jgi:hypothetical protein
MMDRDEALRLAAEVFDGTGRPALARAMREAVGEGATTMRSELRVSEQRFTRDEVMLLTPDWAYERFPHGNFGCAWFEMIEGDENGGRRALLRWAANGATLAQGKVSQSTFRRASFMLDVLSLRERTEGLA